MRVRCVFVKKRKREREREGVSEKERACVCVRACVHECVCACVRVCVRARCAYSKVSEPTRHVISYISTILSAPISTLLGV